MPEVLDESHRVFQELLAVIESLPDEVRIDQPWHLVWLDGKRYPAGEFFDHFHDDHEPDIRAWLARVENINFSMNITTLKTIIRHQFGAAIDMLDNTIRACPDGLWIDRLWGHPSEPAGYSQFWYIAYHALFWLDLYLFGAEEGFTPPAPFTLIEMDENGQLPERPYTKDELQAYLDYGRKKCQATIEALTDKAVHRRCRFSWGEVSFAELLIYNMRHVQDHAAQLNLFLGQRVGSAPDYVTQVRSNAA